jgi:predicted regulator of Ras-like GTPase activity (Roadblock/LC7/MglB family)
MGRILSDQGDLAGAFDAWADALRIDPMRTGALKGIAFLYFRAGDTAAAIDHLQRAAEADPDDESIAQALAKVRREARGMSPSGTPGPSPAPEPPAEPEPPAKPAPIAPATATNTAVASAVTVEIAPLPQPDPESPFAGLDGGHSLLLVDAHGLRLAGSLRSPDGAETGDRVAAQLAGVSREAARATRLLGLGAWQSISVESADAHFVLVPPTAETMLLAARAPSLPMGRVALLAERAARTAKSWLERVQ